MIRADRQLAALLRGAAPEAPIDEVLLARAEFHGVSALLHEALARHTQAPSAPGLRERLKQRVVDATARALLRQHELARLLGVLARAGIEPVVLKGQALAHVLYGRPALRPSLDIDLMVPPAQRRRVLDLLRAEGYQGGAFEGGALVNAQAACRRELAPGVDASIDLHWRISTSPLFAHVLPYEWLRARAQPVPALGPHAFGPASVDALLHACVHRAALVCPPGEHDPASNRADRLIWLCDIHLLALRLGAPGWADFLELARRHRLREICSHALAAAADWLGTPVAGILEALREASAPEPSAALLRGGRWRLKGAELSSLPSWRERALYLYETALPAPGYLMDQYGTRRRWLLPALYVRRALGRLAG